MPRKKQQDHKDDDCSQSAVESSLLELHKMLQRLMTAQEKQEERTKQEQARQDQRWKGMVHNFNVLQEEVRQERWELGKGQGKVRLLEGLHGTSTSAPVSTATSPLRAGTGGAQIDPWWAAGGQGSAAAVPTVVPGTAGITAVPGAAAATQAAMIGVQAPTPDVPTGSDFDPHRYYRMSHAKNSSPDCGSCMKNGFVHRPIQRRRSVTC